MWWRRSKTVTVDDFNKQNEQWQSITRVEDLPMTLDTSLTTWTTLVHFMALLYKENRRLHDELKNVS